MPRRSPPLQLLASRSMVGRIGGAEGDESGGNHLSLVATEPVADLEHAGNTDDTDQLIGRARNGDPDAVAELYRRHVSIVFGYLRANGCTNADDATADVFEGMLKSIHRFRGDTDDFRRWLMTIAHRRLIDDRRRRRRRRSNEVNRDALADHEPGTVRFPNNADPFALDTELVAALSKLTDAQRQVIGLRFIGDLSIEQAATVTGRSVTAVKALQRRGLAALRRSLVRTDSTTGPDASARRRSSWRSPR